MSRPKKRLNLPNFALATEESKRVIAAFKSQTVGTTSVREINRASSASSKELAAGIKRAVQ